jgi:hypothetical protein
MSMSGALAPSLCVYELAEEWLRTTEEKLSA